MRHEPGCVFCRIVKGEIPSDKVYENTKVIAFRDIEPAAPIHVLVVPREHIASLDDLQPTDDDTAAALLLACREVAQQEGAVEHGYRVVTNVGEWGGQTIDHLHLHILGGRPMGRLG